MEADQSQPTAAESPADAVAAPEVSASEPQTEAPSQRVNMNDVMRQAAGMAPASKSDAAPASSDDDAADEDSAPDGASKSPDQPQGGISRRKAPQRIAELEAETQRLQKLLDEANPPPPDANEEMRKAHLENEARFRRLVSLVDDDPALAETIEVNGKPVNAWHWLQEEKRRRAVAPEMAQHYETVLADETRRLNEQAAARDRAFFDNLRSQVKTSLDLPGIEDAERETLRATTDWLDHVMIQRAAAERVADARHADEISRLRKELEQVKRDGFARARQPVEGGLPTNGPAGRNMNDIMRQIAGVVPR